MSFGKFLASSCLILSAGFAAEAMAQNANHAPMSAQVLPLDTPTDVNGVETVCTGIDSDSRNDPRWLQYPLRLEFAAGNRAYIADESVSIMGEGAALAVHCQGPWVLAKLPPGSYSVVASVGGTTKNAKVNVPRTGQSRVVIHFPEVPAGEAADEPPPSDGPAPGSTPQ